MLKNYFKIAVRSVLKNQVFSLINVMGLAVGMAACVLIMQYVQTEFSYDQFHAKKSDIYRLQQNRYDKGELSTQWAAGCAGVGPALKESLPEVIEQVKMHGSNAVLANGDISFREERTYYASEAFFEIFSYNLIEGVDSLVLKEPYKVVLSESTAKKYFKEENPMGKTLNLNGRWDFEVTGIFEDVPENTHMKFDVLFSFETYVDLVSENARTAWQWDGFYTYIMLEPGTDPKELESKIPAIVEQYAGEELKQFDAGQEFLLQSLSDIHLYSDYMMEFEANGDGDATYFLAIIAVFIMIIAWINYINLATAKSLDRAREVGVRKVMGSFKSQLVKQFLMESFLLNAIAVVLALGIVLVALPYFNTLSGKTLTFALISTPEFWLTLTVLFILGGFLSGLYPAFVLSGFKPVSVLKGKFRASDKGNMLRKGLVIFQFFASVFLMVGTFTVYKQITYMRSQDLGVDIAKTLVLRSPNVTDSTYQSKYDAFKQHIGQYANVEFVSASTAVPGRQPDWNAGGIRRVHQDESYSKQYRIVGGDYDFVEAYQLEMAVGRTFSEERSTEESKVLFNESAVALMGFEKLEDALNEEIYFWGDTFEIVGVLKDYHQESMKKATEPLIFRLIPGAGPYYSIKMNVSNVNESIAQIEADWKAFFPGNPFEYFFLDDYYNEQYKADLQFGNVFGLFAGLAVFIACLGLFGLSSFTAMQRTKEIGVRKALGATVSSILTLLSKDFTRLVIVGIVLAVPLSWYVMDNWLNDFANRISLSWWIFLLPGVLVTAIALLTVSYQTIKAATTNPVKSLRYE